MHALVRAGQRIVTLGGDDLGVLIANLGELRFIYFPAKAVHRIGTEERERMGLAQFVPEFFQADRRRPVPICPEERDQFPKDAHAVPTLRRSRDHAPNDLGEAPRRRLPIDHELRQRSGRIDGDVLTSHAGGSNFQPISLQSFLKAFSVRLRSYNDAGIPCPQAGADEFAHRVYKERVSLTELDEMLRFMASFLLSGCFLRLGICVRLFRYGRHALSSNSPAIPASSSKL